MTLFTAVVIICIALYLATRAICRPRTQVEYEWQQEEIARKKRIADARMNARMNARQGLDVMIWMIFAGLLITVLVAAFGSALRP